MTAFIVRDECVIALMFVCWTEDMANEDDDDDNDDDEGENEKGWSHEDEEEFRKQMDKDGDGMLNRDEIYYWLVPEDFDHIADESNHLFAEADYDKVHTFPVSILSLLFLFCSFSECFEIINASDVRLHFYSLMLIFMTKTVLRCVCVCVCVCVK